MTLVSIVVPTYKMGRYIAHALDSVGSQTYHRWELLIVDDCGPDDGTAEIVSAFSQKHPANRIEFIRHAVNTGVSGARNTAISASTGELVAFLDPDDLWLPEYLERVTSAFEKNPEISVCSTPVEAIRDTPDGVVTDPIRFQPWQINQFPSSLAAGNFMQPSSTVIRRTTVTNIGGFDTSPEIQHIEDYDLWIRLAGSGVKFLFINENLTRYRKHEAAATSNTRRMNELHENLARKHAPFLIHAQSTMLRNLLVRQDRTYRFLKNPLRELYRRWFT